MNYTAHDAFLAISAAEDALENGNITGEARAIAWRDLTDAKAARRRASYRTAVLSAKRVTALPPLASLFAAWH